MKEKSICKVDKYGTKRWYGRLHRKLSREDGPAVEYPDGTKFWYLNGKFHREDGPAVEYTDGTKDWWLNGTKYSKKDYYKELVKRNIMTYEEAVLEML